MANKKTHILEGGCGFGAWCEWFKNEGHCIIGIEYDKNIVNKAKKYKKDVAVELGDITKLRFKDNEFDAYISLGVIEHFELGPERALEEAHRILRPDGLAFVSTPLLTPIRQFISHPIRSLTFSNVNLAGKPIIFGSTVLLKRNCAITWKKQVLRSFLEALTIMSRLLKIVISVYGQIGSFTEK